MKLGEDEIRIVRTPLVCDACSKLPGGQRCPATCARNFVQSSWSSSLHHSRDSGMIAAEDFAPFMHTQIAKFCSRRESRVFVALGNVADTYLGFIAGEPTERIVYYCFVKEVYRRRGLAKQLFEALGVDPKQRFAFPAETRILTDHSTRLRTKIPRAVHDPSVARYPKAERHRSYTT